MSEPIITGLVHVTGEPDSGKTTFAYSAGPAPKEIAFFDDDLKAETVNKRLHFGAYYNLHRLFAQQKKSKPIDFHNMVLELLNKLPNQGFQLLVFDNFTRMEDGMSDYAEAHMQEISGLSQGQAAKMSQLTWPYRFNYYSQVLDLMLSKAPLVILTTHIKDEYAGNVKTGLKIPRGQRPLVEKSSLRVWLRHNPDSPEPIGLILKRISTQVFEDGKIKTVSVLPRRVKPCTWDRINWYMDNPIGLREPEPEEIPSESDLSVLDGTLTPDQKDALRLARMAADAENPPMNLFKQEGSFSVVKEELPREQQELIQELLSRNFSPPQVKQQVEGVTIKQVMDVKKNGVVVKLEVEE